jgi:hypothetical protein
MLEARTADCLAIANTAVLMRLIDEFIERGLIGRQGANALLATPQTLSQIARMQITAISRRPSGSSATS